MAEKVSQADIDRANDMIVQVVSGYVPELKRAGKNWSACCPFHKEKSPSFTVSEDKRMYYCFGCGAGGDAVSFVVEMNPGMQFRKAVESILGDITLESAGVVRAPVVRAVQCSLPGHAENRDKTAEILDSPALDAAPTHLYFIRNNTSPQHGCFTMKGKVIVPLINNIGENVNLAAINADGNITYAAGAPSFGSTAILEPSGEVSGDGKSIICVDYAHAWRIWWSQSGRSKVLACLDHGNFLWMLANCKDRFTHIGCDPVEADEHVDLGRAIVALPIDPYARKVDRSASAS